MSVPRREASTAPEPAAGLLERAVVAGRWALLAEAAGRCAQPLVLVVFARLLVPEDFGLVTAAVVAVSFAQIFWDAGLAKALVQRETGGVELEQAAGAVFRANLVLAFALYLAAFALAGPLAAVFGDERIVALVRVQAWAIPLMAVGSVPAALLQRSLNFRPLAAARLVGALAPALVGLPLAWLGAGFWALVVGSLAGAAASAVALLALSPWKPRWKFPGGGLRQLLPFGLWSTGDGMIMWLMLWGDTIIVGLSLSGHELGLYRTGEMAVRAAFGATVGAVMPVLFVTFARVQGQPELLRSIFVRAGKGVAFVASLLFVLGAAAPAELSATVFGRQWQELGPVVFYLTAAHALGWLVAANAELYRAIGRPDVNARIVAGCLVVYLSAYGVAARHGLEVFLPTRLGLAVLGCSVHVLVAAKLAGVAPWSFVRNTGRFVLAAVLAVAAAALVREQLTLGTIARYAIATMVALSVYALVAAGERRFIAGFVREVLRRGDRPDRRETGSP